MASDDIPHVFHVSPVWLIPTPQLRGFAGKALKGWELASIATWRSGTPFSVSSGVDNSLSGVGADRADFIGTDLGQARLSGQSHAQEIQQFFKTSLFVRNAIGTYGNSGKDILLGPRSFNTDLSLIKDTNITERAKLQFRAEFFNLFNNVNFSNPGGTLGNPNLGRITSAGDPRILSACAKVYVLIRRGAGLFRSGELARVFIAPFKSEPPSEREWIALSPDTSGDPA